MLQRSILHTPYTCPYAGAGFPGSSLVPHTTDHRGTRAHSALCFVHTCARTCLACSTRIATNSHAYHEWRGIKAWARTLHRRASTSRVLLTTAGHSFCDPRSALANSKSYTRYERFMHTHHRRLKINIRERTIRCFKYETECV